MTRILIAALVLIAACGPTPTPDARPTIAPSAPAGACHAGPAVLCELNGAVTQATIGRTICVSGWTATIRPPASYTDALKRQQLAAFASLHAGDPQWNVAGVEEDHRLPLDLGGAPRDPHNLSPEVHRDSAAKDQDEAALGGSRGRVCRGELTLAAAQQQFIAHWLAPWPGYLA